MSEQINFDQLNIHFIKDYSIEKQKEIFTYLNEMNEDEKKTYEIAVNHLGSSFNVYRSNGFISWKKIKESK